MQKTNITLNQIDQATQINQLISTVLNKYQVSGEERIPGVGKFIEHFPLGVESTWFRVGGAVRLLFEPESAASLSEFLRQIDDKIPVSIVGAGSNTLVRDAGVLGIVIRLGKGFRDVQQIAATSVSNVGNEDIVIQADAAALQRQVAIFAAKNGISGFGFMRGIPGSIGGGIKMNSGAYNSEFVDVLHSVKIVRRNGSIEEINASKLDLQYRHSNLKSDDFVVSAVFVGKQGDSMALKAQLDDVLQRRKDTQPVGERTGGSTFRNPAGHSAWKLIDAAGGRGLRIGSAQVSPKHCNFLIQTGSGKGDDIEELGETVRSMVYKNSGIKLQWEVKRIGSKKAENK